MEGQDGLPPTPGSELTALTSANLQALTAGAPGTAPGRKAPVRKRRGGKKRKRKHTAGDAPRHISLASPAGSWSGRTPARGAPGWQGARQEQAARKAGSAPWTTPRTVPPAPFNSTEDILDRKEEASVKEADPQQAGGAAINFFGSNADATRHFAEDEEESSDDGDTGTEGELLDAEEQAARIASLEQDKEALAAENVKLAAEVEALRLQLAAARQGQPPRCLPSPAPIPA